MEQGFDYIIQSGNKQYTVIRDKSFLVDKLPGVKEKQSVDIVCLYQNGKYGKTSLTAQVVSTLERSPKKLLSKRKGRSHHSRGIKTGRTLFTRLIVDGGK